MSDRAGRASNECHSFERPPTWNEFRPTSTTSLQHWIVELRGIPSFVARCRCRGRRHEHPRRPDAALIEPPAQYDVSPPAIRDGGAAEKTA
jgi:hypothetical protein